MARFMQTIDDVIYEELKKVASERGIGVQLLIKAIIIPEWIRLHGYHTLSDHRSPEKSVNRKHRTPEEPGTLSCWTEGEPVSRRKLRNIWYLIREMAKEPQPPRKHHRHNPWQKPRR